MVRGTKVFTLMPPCDAFRMRLRRFPAASYMRRRDVPPGARFGEVSPQPGALPHVGMAAAGGGGSNVSSGRSGLPPKQVAGPDTSDPDRLVAVLNVSARVGMVGAWTEICWKRFACGNRQQGSCGCASVCVSGSWSACSSVHVCMFLCACVMC